MGRIVITEFVSLDGVMEEPRWTFQFNRGPEGDRFKLDELFGAEALLLGRVTYQGFAAAWPHMTDEEQFAERMNGIRKYVVSSTLADEEANWGETTVIRGDVATEIAKLRDSVAGDLLVEGSAQLVHLLLQEGLVDELRLMVFPIVLGGGKRMYPDAMDPSRSFSLVEVAQAGGGVLMQRYQPLAA